MAGRTPRPTRTVFPSPVVMLSIIAVAMAGIAYVATRGAEPTEREVTTVAQAPETPGTPSATPDQKNKNQNQGKKKEKPAKPAIKRGEVPVVVFNNSGITGLAGEVAGSVSEAGWQVVGSDNWYGSIPANTVYHPKQLKDEAEQLALDLGIDCTAIAVDPMQFDRLTVILTSRIG